LGRQLQELAAAQASVDHDFCVLVDQFDNGHAVRWFDGIRSTAHYVSQAASTPTWSSDPVTGPTRIFPAHAGEGFSLHECVRVLFDIAVADLSDVA
jgi:hypothetical protein